MSFHLERDKQPDLSQLIVEEAEPEELLGPIKLEDQLHQPFVDCLVPDCNNYPWGHPRFCAPPFQAHQWFCNEGMRIPIWFHGEEQLGSEAVQVPVGEKTPVDLVQAALVHQCSKASRAIQQKVQEIRNLKQFAADAHTACFWAGQVTCSLACFMRASLCQTYGSPQCPEKHKRPGVRRDPAPNPLLLRMGWGPVSSTGN